MSVTLSGKSILNEKFVEIVVDENNIIVAKWKGYLKPEDLKTGSLALIDGIKKHKVTSHFSDQTTLKVLSKESQEYLVTEALPKIAQAGVKKLGVQVADDVFAKATVDKVNATLKIGNMEVKTFLSSQECNEWLKA